MKPFDLELAKAGHPVCTRDGQIAPPPDKYLKTIKIEWEE